jgi:hypothetical protein
MNVLNTQLVTLAAATTVAIPAGTRCIQDNVAGTTASNVDIGATTFTLDVSKGTFLGTNPMTVHLGPGTVQGLNECLHKRDFIATSQSRKSPFCKMGGAEAEAEATLADEEPPNTSTSTSTSTTTTKT